MPQELQESGIDHREAPAALQPGGASPPNWRRLAYSFEYLLALLVSVVLWTQVGGQGHMDLLAWYLKLPCILLQAWCTVRFTAAIVEAEKPWNRRSRFWFTGLLLTAALMAGITFYYHIHEVSDEPDSEEINTSVGNSRLAKSIWQA